MKVMLTGVSGFIGSNLLEFLMRHNYDIVGIDKNINLKRIGFVGLTEKQKEQVGNHYINDKLSIINDDISELQQYSAVLKEKDIDIVYHLAAASDINRSFKEPTWDLKENVNGTHYVLEFMRKHDIKNIVFTSTSVVYGEDAPLPTPETYTDYNPISQYAASKIAAETFIKTYVNIYGLKAWIFRFANVVGKNEHRGVIPDFIRKLKKNPKELEILGNGKQVKSYFHVSDCVDAMVQIPSCDTNKNVETYNIATYDQIDVDCVANIICDKLNVTPKITYTGGDRGWIGDVPIVVLSTKKALSIGWKPMFDCRMSIKKTVEALV